MTAPFDLLAFDLDGTLADTEAMTLPDLIDLLTTQFGIPITLAHFKAHYHGMSGQSLLDKLNAEYGTTLDWPTFKPLRMARLEKVFENGIPPAPGMFQALKLAAAEGYQMCICSNSNPERIGYSLQKITGQHGAGVFLDRLFEGHLFSATDPAQPHAPKPAPDVYAAATQAYKATPARCLAVEDTPIGVQSAVAAGLTCLGYVGLATHPQEETAKLKAAGVADILTHWDDFLPCLQKLGK